MVSRNEMAALLFSLAVGAACLAAPARADVVVTGSGAAIEVQASKSTIAEVLQKLSTTYALEVEGAEDLKQPVSGTFKGDLRAVVEQVLGTQNHVVKTSGAKLSVIVVGAPATVKTADLPVSPDDPLKAAIEKRKPILSPEGQEMAVKLFGEKGRYLQVDENVLRSFATRRGGTRYKAGEARIITGRMPAPQ